MKKLLALLFMSVFLAACQHIGDRADSATALLAKVTQPQEKEIAYFDADWKRVDQPDPDGFFRKLYGKTADGHYIAQDFYAANRAKQTDPFEIIDEEGLTKSDNSHNTGVIIWYDLDGNKIQKERYNNGVSAGAREIYYPGGESKVIVAPHRGNREIMVFYENGKKMGVVTGAADHAVVNAKFWHENGKPANELYIKDSPPDMDDTYDIKGWGKDGKILSTHDARVQFLIFLERISSLLSDDR